MKCGVLTIHRATNFGAVMQAYALQTVLRNIGVDSEIIDYRSEFIEKHITPKKIFTYFSIKGIYLLICRNSYIIDNRKNFGEFLKKYVPISEVIYTADNIKDSNIIYDKFIVGSDQIWSNVCAGFDKTYFLDFVYDDKKKNSYSASYGFDNWPTGTMEIYRNLLNSFNNISIREHQGKLLTESLLQRKIKTTLDPVMLLSNDDWNKLTLEINEKKPYLLLYLMAETKSVFNLAKKIAKERHLKIIYISERLLNHFGVKNLKKIKPIEWLSYFNNAEYIVTNSFHGTAFSIKLEKNFSVELLPEPSKVNSRITDLLVLLGLEDRISRDGKYKSGDINTYEKVNMFLENQIYESLNYLKEILQQ